MFIRINPRLVFLSISLTLCIFVVKTSNLWCCQTQLTRLTSKNKNYNKHQDIKLNIQKCRNELENVWGNSRLNYHCARIPLCTLTATQLPLHTISVHCAHITISMLPAHINYHWRTHSSFLLYDAHDTTFFMFICHVNYLKLT